MKERAEEGIISQTRSLYSRLSERARHLAQEDRQAAGQRGPVTKALLVACLAAALVGAATLAYGIAAFPDAPIRQTASGYVGKHGEPRTRDVYERFKVWEGIVLGSFGLALLTGVGAVVTERMSRGEGEK